MCYCLLVCLRACLFRCFLVVVVAVACLLAIDGLKLFGAMFVTTRLPLCFSFFIVDVFDQLATRLFACLCSSLLAS